MSTTRKTRDTRPARTILEQHFERTTCDCSKCGAACRTMPGNLVPGDLERIYEHATGQPATNDGASTPSFDEWTLEHFEASSGAVVATIHNGTMIQRSVPSIVPRQVDAGRCVFLQGGKCAIHPVAPWGCAFFSVCTNEHRTADETDRVRAGIAATIGNGEHSRLYTEQHQQLNDAGRIAAPLADRKAAFSRELSILE